MGIFQRTTDKTIKIPIPRLGFKRYNDTINWVVVAGVAWASLAFVIVASFTLGGTYWVIRNRVIPAPKPKTIYTTELTYAQKEFVKQCEQNGVWASAPNDGGGWNYAIPNLTVSPWTCTYADNTSQ